MGTPSFRDTSLATLNEDEVAPSPGPSEEAPSPSPHGTPRTGRSRSNSHDVSLMGPILRHKKVVSLPLGSDPRRQEFFFDTPQHTAHRTKQKSEGAALLSKGNEDEEKHVAGATTPPPEQQHHRVKVDSFMAGILRRKQVSLDLMAAEGLEFFAPSAPVEVEPTVEEEVPTVEEEVPTAEEEEKPRKKPFYPLQYAPRTQPVRGVGDGGHGAGGRRPPEEPEAPDEETVEVLKQQKTHNQELKQQVDVLTEKLEERDGKHGMYEILLNNVQTARKALEEDTVSLETKLLGVETASFVSPPDTQGEPPTAILQQEADDDIVRATKSDYIRTSILATIMLGFTLACCLWHTHIETVEHVSLGLGCITPCLGDVETQDFFFGHYTFKENQIIEMQMALDPSPYPDAEVLAQIVGVQTNAVKANITFGPPDEHYHQHFTEEVKVDFANPEEEHVINVYSSTDGVELSFSLNTIILQPIAEWSVLIAAIIMIIVYILILIEVIHRTLVAIFGAMVALLFLAIMRGGATESIRSIMIFMEWSTLGLLFGMMIIVGELSHTGIFEWVSVRLLVASKGSFNRLFALLGLLTAVSSAFLDNVTTMLLVAPVTIDMCRIVDVDPRPYLIGEVLLSNIGGTATLIGDPPNIIIGSSFNEISFVDFIINVLPCIFLFCIPASMILNMQIFRYYLGGKMPELESDQLKRAYPIYDQPRLLIAGTVAVFVILLFFLHPIHHKDTAWIALFGAFITMAFTNPHDVQDALRNFVEWDVMLFFAGLFVLVEACAAMGLLSAIGEALARYIESQPEDQQLAIAITLVIWVSAITSAFLDNIPYTATMIPIIQIMSDTLPETLPLETLAWALSFGACLGGNGTLLGASANIVTAGISCNKGYAVSFMNFFYPGMSTMILTVAISNLYMLVVYVWI